MRTIGVVLAELGRAERVDPSQRGERAGETVERRGGHEEHVVAPFELLSRKREIVR
jgi:hypothetical protein